MAYTTKGQTFHREAGQRRALLKSLARSLVLEERISTTEAKAKALLLRRGYVESGGKAALLSYQLWAEDVNARGGLLGRKVELVLRDSYRKVIDLISQDQIDFAWVSAYPFVYLQQHAHLRLLATPLFHGRPFFRAYLIVPATDTQTSDLLSLKGKFFAYADPYSHTGYLVPRYQLQQAGEAPGSFFARTFFTGGHNLFRLLGRFWFDRTGKFYLPRRSLGRRLGGSP